MCLCVYIGVVFWMNLIALHDEHVFLSLGMGVFGGSIVFTQTPLILSRFISSQFGVEFREESVNLPTVCLFYGKRQETVSFAVLDVKLSLPAEHVFEIPPSFVDCLYTLNNPHPISF